MNKGSAIIAILVAFIGGFAIGNVVGGGGGSDVEEAQGAAPAVAQGEEERYNIPVSNAQPSKGPADALVTIVEFSDFECPFCSRVGPTLSRVATEYGDKVRIVWRNQPLPFHQNARPAAAVALEAFAQGGNDKFWKAHDLFFQNQKALDRGSLERYAQQLGLDAAKVKAALDGGTHNRAIDADSRLGTQLGASGTPSFFINGRPLVGARPFEQFKELIDDELARAEKLVAAGTPKAKVYAALTAGRPAAKAAQQAPERPQQRQPDPKAVYKVPVSGQEPSKGPADALVTIVEFSDFECPFCGRVEPTIADVLERYGKDVRVVWMNNPLPFHKNATPAATAALEAFEQGGNDKFWAMHEKLFANQRALSPENLEAYAAELKLDVKKVKAAIESEKFKETITAQQTLARGLGAAGTPSFFINGRNIRGAQPLPAFTAIIDEELARAKALVEAGTSRAEVYAKAIADGKTSPQFIGGDAAPPPQPRAPSEPQVYKIADAPKAPFKGGKNAKVVIQEFSDFECPFCSRVLPTLKEIEKEYGDKVRIVWRNYPLPFHQNAGPAAQAALEVYAQGGNDKFWAYHDLLFANQRALTRADLEKYAQQVGGINMAKFKAALDSGKHAETVKADQTAVESAGARIGTPSFFINGALVQGAQPFPAFKAAIDKALAEAG